MPRRKGTTMSSEWRREILPPRALCEGVGRCRGKNLAQHDGWVRYEDGKKTTDYACLQCFGFAAGIEGPTHVHGYPSEWSAPDWETASRIRGDKSHWWLLPELFEPARRKAEAGETVYLPYRQHA